MLADWILFFGLALVAVASALGLLLSKNAIYAALNLIINFVTVAIFYLTLGAPFISLIQVAVYAGAIMVLFLFVIMLLNLEKEQKFIPRVRLQKVFGVFFGLVLLFQIGAVFHSLFLTGEKGLFPPDKVAVLGNTEVVARLLFTDFLLPFEITSVLLLVAIIGAVILAKR